MGMWRIYAYVWFSFSIYFSCIWTMTISIHEIQCIFLFTIKYPSMTRLPGSTNLRILLNKIKKGASNLPRFLVLLLHDFFLLGRPKQSNSISLRILFVLYVSFQGLSIPLQCTRVSRFEDAASVYFSVAIISGK